jgi:hypothetical protein
VCCSGPVKPPVPAHRYSRLRVQSGVVQRQGGQVFRMVGGVCRVTRGELPSGRVLPMAVVGRPVAISYCPACLPTCTRVLGSCIRRCRVPFYRPSPRAAISPGWIPSRGTRNNVASMLDNIVSYCSYHRTRLIQPSQASIRPATLSACVCVRVCVCWALGPCALPLMD